MDIYHIFLSGVGAVLVIGSFLIIAYLWARNEEKYLRGADLTYYKRKIESDKLYKSNIPKWKLREVSKNQWLLYLPYDLGMNAEEMHIFKSRQEAKDYHDKCMRKRMVEVRKYANRKKKEVISDNEEAIKIASKRLFD